MASKENALAALERDGRVCQWCLWELGILNPARGKPHHLFGKRFDEPQHQITLCMMRIDMTTGCHQRYHNAVLDEAGELEITQPKLIALMLEHAWHGEDLTPQIHRTGSP